MVRRFNISEEVRERVIQLVAQLIDDANTNQTIGYWQRTDRHRPQLVIQSKTAPFLAHCYKKALAHLLDPKKARATASEWWYNDRHMLIDRLGILEDRRANPNGARVLDLILTLWSTAPDSNSDLIRQQWDQPQTSVTSLVIHDLPPRPSYPGYKEQRQQLTALLASPTPPALIAIDGPGGSGKTSLVITAIQPQLSDPDFPFPVVIFTSAQSQICTPHGIASRLKVDRTLRDICQHILITLKTPAASAFPADRSELITKTLSALAQQRTLLIIDNIETADPNDLKQLFTFVRELPVTVTTIITSRVRLGWGQVISLKGLSVSESLQLIQQMAKQINMTITLDQAKQLHSLTSGLPLAIEYLMMRAYQQGSLQPLAQPPSCRDDLMRFFFAELMENLRGKFTQRLLSAFALFQHPATTAAVFFIADLAHRPLVAHTALEDLRYCHLINATVTDTYALHALTRTYSRQELSQDPYYAQQYYNRWVAYYHNYTHPYSQLNWRDWQDYSGLATEWFNLRDVVEYCLDNEQLDSFATLWQGLQGYTLIQGKWAERLDWLDRWATFGQADPHHLAPALYYHSQTLAHQNEAASASIPVAQQAWQLVQKLDPDPNSSLPFDIALHLAAVHIRQPPDTPSKLTIARQWLQTAQVFLQQQSDGQNRVWQQAQMMYYQAEIQYCEGHYHKAQEIYRQTQQLAIAISFQRLTTYASSRMALTAHKLGHFQAAHDRFQQVLEQSLAHQDHRAIATTQFNLARVQHDRRQPREARVYGEQAQQSFEQLLMSSEVAQVKAFLQELSA
jgi:NB-ARC domain